MRKILIVDDETEFAEMVKMRLEAEGFEVVCAADGETGISLAAQDRPALILLDVMMPGMDGFSVLKQLHRNPATKGIPVVMLTARSETRSIFRAQDLGVVDYLIKPCDSKELVGVVRKHA